MPTFEITEVEANPRSWEAKKGPAAGQKFLSYSVQAKGPDGQTADYEISRRPESQPPALGPDEYTVEPPPWDGALPKLKKSGGNFTAPKYERVPDQHDDRSARIERQSARRDAISYAAIVAEFGDAAPSLDQIKTWTDVLGADVGGGPKSTEASPPTADVSADQPVVLEGDAALKAAGVLLEEATPPQKRKLTTLMGKAGLSRDAMKAVVLFRCRSEKATKDGASKLIQDLMDGATHDTLLAEIHDAKRAGDPLAVRAAALIPSDTPAETEGLPELDDEQKAIAAGGSYGGDAADVPF